MQLLLLSQHFQLCELCGFSFACDETVLQNLFDHFLIIIRLRTGSRGLKESDDEIGDGWLQ